MGLPKVQRHCSPLTQTYGKSAGMVWGRQDHFYDIWFSSVHMRLAPAATSSAQFCGELVGARKDARHSNFRYRWFQVRSQSLLSLGAFGGMVLVRQARQSGTFSCAFCNFHFCACYCCKLVGARKDTLHTNFRHRWFRARSQSLPSLGVLGGMVLVRQARQSGTFSCVFCNFHFCSVMARVHWRL